MTKSLMETAVGFSDIFIVRMLAQNSNLTFNNGIIKGDIHFECDLNPFLHKIGINNSQPLLQ